MKKEYSILVKTGDVYHAGTSAKVYIKLHDVNGKVVSFRLDNKDKNDFERNQSDGFTVSTEEMIGDIRQIEMCHDNSGPASGWFLDFVVVVDLSDQNTYKANFDMWLKESQLSHTVDVQPMNVVCA